VFGIATLHAGILSRWAAGLLAVAGALVPAAALLPLERQPLVVVPVGIALAWLGYALWSERREQAAESDDGVLTGVEQPAVVPSKG
jgi:membrane protein implicated in regulation of membrane protease activity